MRRKLFVTLLTIGLILATLHQARAEVAPDLPPENIRPRFRAMCGPVQMAFFYHGTVGQNKRWITETFEDALVSVRVIEEENGVLKKIYYIPVDGSLRHFESPDKITETEIDRLIVKTVEKLGGASGLEQYVACQDKLIDYFYRLKRDSESRNPKNRFR